MSIIFSKYENVIVAKAIKAQVPNMDWEDVAQELRIHLWLKGNLFNPMYASASTFVNNILNNKIRDLIKAAYRKKRFLDTNHLTFSEILREENGEYLLESATPIEFLGLIAYEG